MRIEFDSLKALAEFADKAPTDGASSQCDEDYGVYDWTYGVNRPGAVKLAKHGWPQGAAKAKRLLDDTDLPPIEEICSATEYDVTGSYVDVGEYVQGSPECMVNFKEDKRTVRFVHIIVSGCYSASFKGDEVMQRGVAIAAVIDALEARGVRCSVELLTRFADDFDVSCRLKETTDALNLDVLTFAIAHPATFRRLLFGVGDAQTEAIRKKHGFTIGGGYGYPRPITDENAMVFPTMEYRDKWDKATAQRKIKEAVDKYASNK